ncbi:MAG: pyrroline-5-carboxylate reductase [Christensenellales bacterium]|jgi:pyrroline-5-carboxylate reductase
MLIGFIGLGNMARAIIAGMRGNDSFRNTPILGSDHNEGKRLELGERWGVTILEDDISVARQADLLVLAVKPQALPVLFERIVPVRKPGQCALSLAAGKPLSWLAEALGVEASLIRAMPNVAARVGGSVTALCANDRATEAQKALTTDMFSAVGQAVWMTEERMKAFSTLTGAAPAFTFLYLEALASAGLKAGLPKKIALEAAAHMMMGAAKLALETGEHPASLIDQVTSPGGTTIEGMHTLKALGFEHAVHEAVKAVMEKEQKLQGNGK